MLSKTLCGPAYFVHILWPDKSPVKTRLWGIDYQFINQLQCNAGLSSTNIKWDKLEIREINLSFSNIECWKQNMNLFQELAQWKEIYIYMGQHKELNHMTPIRPIWLYKLNHDARW